MAFHCSSFLKKHDIKVVGYVVSDGLEKADHFNGLPVYYYSEIPYGKADTLIIQANRSKEVTAVLEASDWKWLQMDHLL